MKPDAEVLIRPLRIDDVPALYEAVRESLPLLCLWMPWCHPDYAIEESQTWIEKQIPAFQAGEEFTFAIVSASDQFLGVVGLNAIDRDNRRANLGYWVRVSASARGVATTATRFVASMGVSAYGPEPSGACDCDKEHSEPASRGKGRSGTRGNLAQPPHAAW